MGIASTKSQFGKAPTGSIVRSGQHEEPPGWDFLTFRTTWLIAAGAILLLAAILRIYNLDLVPLHHDEGVNGNFLVRLVRDGQYHYDPANYHGPTLYYFAAVFPWLLRLLFGQSAQNSFGLTTTAIRMVPVLFGIGTVALIFTLRRNLGTIATLMAGLLLAVSPGAVYLSRYFIHETLFAFFTVGIVVCIVKYYENGEPLFLFLAAVSAALLFATKETAIISVGALVIALVMAVAYRSIMKSSFDRGAMKKRKKLRNTSDLERNFLERAGGPRWLTLTVIIAIAIFIAVNVVFYSSFFKNYPKGVWDALKTFEFWTKTGKEAHVHPPVTYVWWLLLQESPLLFLGAIGALVSVFKPSKPFALFVSLWAFGLIAAYSLIAYKTPWLTLNFIVPLALVSGVAIQWMYNELAKFEVRPATRVYILALVLLLITSLMPGTARAVTQGRVYWSTFIPGYQTIDLNFRNYDNDDRYYVYVYAHTRRETLKLLEEINRIAQRTQQGGQTGITIVSPDYWPLPWYLRDYSRVGYYGRMTQSNEPIIIASQGQAQEVTDMFGDRYELVQSGFNTSGSFSLRPGVDLLLYTRRELVR